MLQPLLGSLDPSVSGLGWLQQTRIAGSSLGAPLTAGEGQVEGNLVKVPCGTEGPQLWAGTTPLGGFFSLIH